MELLGSVLGTTAASPDGHGAGDFEAAVSVGRVFGVPQVAALVRDEKADSGEGGELDGYAESCWAPARDRGRVGEVGYDGVCRRCSTSGDDWGRGSA